MTISQVTFQWIALVYVLSALGGDKSWGCLKGRRPSHSTDGTKALQMQCGEVSFLWNVSRGRLGIWVNGEGETFWKKNWSTEDLAFILSLGWCPRRAAGGVGLLSGTCAWFPGPSIRDGDLEGPVILPVAKSLSGGEGNCSSKSTLSPVNNNVS